VRATGRLSLQREGTRIAIVPSLMKVRLTKKLAEQLDGVDVSARREGDVLDLSAHDAKMLVEERWAIPERRERSESIHGRGRRADDDSRLRSESSH
jgi:hypothetical protein